eukprot:2214805-Prymnesium_polylepis.1
MAGAAEARSSVKARGFDNADAAGLEAAERAPRVSREVRREPARARESGRAARNVRTETGSRTPQCADCTREAGGWTAGAEQ